MLYNVSTIECRPAPRGNCRMATGDSLSRRLLLILKRSIA